MSAAAALAHERNGHLHVTSDVAAEALARLRRCIGARGFGALVGVYGVVTLNSAPSPTPAMLAGSR